MTSNKLWELVLANMRKSLDGISQLSSKKHGGVIISNLGMDGWECGVNALLQEEITLVFKS